MAAQPPKESDVQMVIEFSAGLVDRADALRYLKVANNEVQAAVNLIFDDTSLEELERQRQPQQSQGYDEGAFTQDRYGGYGQDSNVPAFQIDAADDDMQYPRSSAPTRPPSRVSTRTIDSAINLNDVPVSGRTSRMDIDRSGQETGVMGGSGVHFGPANKSHYDTNQWAMTLAQPRVTESVPDVEPQQRRRQNDEPAFLKPLPSRDFLPNLISILHCIPLSHNALLFDSNLLADYGHEPNWWTGTPTKVRGPIVVDGNLDDSSESDIVRESQRLMAFLDATERSYGSAEALSGMEDIVSVQHKDTGEEMKDLFEKFLINWELNALRMDPDSEVEKIFRSEISSEHGTNAFWTMDINLGAISASKPWSLYDVLDELIYVPVEPTPSIKRFGQILVLRITHPELSEGGLDMELPSSWYVDRYLEENLEKTKVMKGKISECRGRIARIAKAQNEVQKWTDHRTETDVDALALVRASMAAFKKTEATEIVDEFTGRTNRKHSDRTHGHVLEALQAVCESVELKVKSLENEKNRIWDELQKTSELFKTPTSDARTNPRFRYFLAGCSPSPNVTYTLQNSYARPSQVNSASVPAAQWWRMQYNNDSSQPYISKDKVSEEEVLRAAREDSRDCLLVYADDDALRATPKRLPRTLEEFVQYDNMAFRQELEETTIHAMGDWDREAVDIDMDYGTEPPPYNDWAEKGGLELSEITDANSGAFAHDAELHAGDGTGRIGNDVIASDDMTGLYPSAGQGGAEHVERVKGRLS